MERVQDSMICSPHPQHLLTLEPGKPFMENLKDRRFGYPGTYTLYRGRHADLDLLWLNPMPEEAELWKAYKNYYTHAAVEGPYLTFKRKLIRDLKNAILRRQFGYPVDVPAWAMFLSLVLYLDMDILAEVKHSVMHLGPLPGGRCLEVGCGNGATLRRLKELGWSVEGTDADQAAAEAAAQSGIKVHVGSLLDLGLPTNSYDAIALSHVIEHLPRQEEHFKEFYRLLKPGGRLVLVTPNVQSVGLKFFKDAWVGLEPPRHLYIYSLASLSAMLVKHGFQSERIYTSTRHTVGNFGASHAIRSQGSFKWGTKHALLRRVLYKAAQYCIFVANLFLRRLGEEIVVIARKN